MKKAADKSGSAAKKRYKEKTARFSAACNKEGIEFYPLVVETFGGWHLIQPLSKFLTFKTVLYPAIVKDLNLFTNLSSSEKVVDCFLLVVIFTYLTFSVYL